jgi:hypothetical protein
VNYVNWNVWMANIRNDGPNAYTFILKHYFVDSRYGVDGGHAPTEVYYIDSGKMRSKPQYQLTDVIWKNIGQTFVKLDHATIHRNKFIDMDDHKEHVEKSICPTQKKMRKYINKIVSVQIQSNYSIEIHHRDQRAIESDAQVTVTDIPKVGTDEIEIVTVRRQELGPEFGFTRVEHVNLTARVKFYDEDEYVKVTVDSYIFRVRIPFDAKMTKKYNDGPVVDSWNVDGTWNVNVIVVDDSSVKISPPIGDYNGAHCRSLTVDQK